MAWGSILSVSGLVQRFVVLAFRMQGFADAWRAIRHEAGAEEREGGRTRDICVIR